VVNAPKSTVGQKNINMNKQVGVFIKELTDGNSSDCINTLSKFRIEVQNLHMISRKALYLSILHMCMTFQPCPN